LKLHVGPTMKNLTTWVFTGYQPGVWYIHFGMYLLRTDKSIVTSRPAFQKK
jgi:hypothetical protein